MDGRLHGIGAEGTIIRVTVVHQLHRLGGVARRGAIVQTHSASELAAALRRGEVVRDARGRYALPLADEALRRANALTGVVSHRSAALHWGWELQHVPRVPDVTVRRKRHLEAAQCSGASLHFVDLDEADVDGLVTTPVRTLLDCLRSLPFSEALTVADSALRHRACCQDDLKTIAGSIRGPGAAKARRVADHATGLAANPFESALRAIALGVPGLDLRPQVSIRDRHGRGRPDLVDVGRRLVIEAESHSFHSRRGALRRDCRRYTRLTLLGWTVLRFAWEDVMFEPEYVRQALVEAVVLTDQQAEPAGR